MLTKDSFLLTNIFWCYQIIENTENYIYIRFSIKTNRTIITSIHPKTQAYEFGSNYVLSIPQLIYFFLYETVTLTYMHNSAIIHVSNQHDKIDWTIRPNLMRCERFCWVLGFETFGVFLFSLNFFIWLLLILFKYNF